MPSIDDPAVFLTGVADGEGESQGQGQGQGQGKVREEERICDGDGSGRVERFGDRYNLDSDKGTEDDDVSATPVRKMSVGMVFSDGEEEEEEEVNDDDDAHSGRFRSDHGGEVIYNDDGHDNGNHDFPHDGYPEDNDAHDEHGGYKDERYANKNGYGHDHHDRNIEHHINTAFSTPTTVISPLPDPDEPLPSIEPHSSPAYPFSSPNSRSVSKSAGNTPSSHHIYNHRQQRNSSDGGDGTDSHLHGHDENTTTMLHYHLRNQHLHGSTRHPHRRRTSLSTDLSATSTISSIPSSVIGIGKGSFERPDDPTLAFAPMSRTPRPIVNRSEMLRMMPRSVPAKISGSSGRGLMDKKNGDVRNGKVGSSCELSIIGGDDDEINSPSRGKGRSERVKMKSKKERTYEDGRSSLSLMSSTENDGDDGDDSGYDHEVDRRQMQTQSALVLPPSPSPSVLPSSSSSQTHSRHDRFHPHPHTRYGDQNQTHTHPGNHTRLQSPMMATKFFTPQPQLPPPLVLLHATILPPALPLPYSPSALSALAPPFIHRNARLLTEKLDAEVLARGVLVAHPHEDYELLEERILESLELVIPRISACGHFLGGAMGMVDEVRNKNEGEQENEDVEEEEEEDIGNGKIIDEYIHDHDNHVREQNPFQGQIASPVISSSTSGAAAARPHCTTCAHPLHIPFSPEDLKPNGDNQLISHTVQFNSYSNDDVNNASTLRWDVRIYAANGLMRAGAWATAWGEMERVDVQIGVWIPEELKSRLEEWDREHDYVGGVGAVEFDGVENDVHGDNNYLSDLDNAIQLENGEETETETETETENKANNDRTRGMYGDSGRCVGGDGQVRSVGIEARGGKKLHEAMKGLHESLARTSPASDDSSSPVASNSERRQQMPTSTQTDKYLANESVSVQQSGELPDSNQRPEEQSWHNSAVPVYDGKEGNQPSTPANMPSSPPPLPPGLGARVGGAASEHVSSFSSSSITSAAKAKNNDRMLFSPSPSHHQTQLQGLSTSSLTHGDIEAASVSPNETTHQVRPDLKHPVTPPSQPATEFTPWTDPQPPSTMSSHPSSSDQPTSSAPHTSSSSSSSFSSSSPTSNRHQPTSNPHKSLITHHLYQPQNIIIILLSMIVAFLAMRGGPATSATSAPSTPLSSSSSSISGVAGQGVNVDAEGHGPVGSIAAGAAAKDAASVSIADDGATEPAVPEAVVVAKDEDEDEDQDEGQDEEKKHNEKDGEVAVPSTSAEDEHVTINTVDGTARSKIEAKADADADAEIADNVIETTNADEGAAAAAAASPNVQDKKVEINEQGDMPLDGEENVVLDENDGGEDLVDALLDS